MAKEGKKKGIIGKVVPGVAVLALIVAVAGSMGCNEPKVADSTDNAKQEQSSDSSSDAQGNSAQDTSSSDEKKVTDLAAGTKVDLGNGLTVSVDSIETGVAGSNGTYVKATVTYANTGSEQQDYNSYDWKGEDANGAQEDVEFYTDSNYNSDSSELGSGSLAPNGTKTGTLYFKDGTTKILYFGNIFVNKDPQASWNVA